MATREHLGVNLLGYQDTLNEQAEINRLVQVRTMATEAVHACMISPLDTVIKKEPGEGDDDGNAVRGYDEAPQYAAAA